MKAEATRRRMEGIIALLLALAAIAERACHAPFPVRAQILWLLRPAETVACDFVYFETGLAVHLPAHTDDLVAEAAGLAARFRVLAFALAGVAYRLFDGVHPPRPAGNADGVSNAGRFSSRPRQPFDTS